MLIRPDIRSIKEPSYRAKFPGRAETGRFALLQVLGLVPGNSQMAPELKDGASVGMVLLD